MRAGILTLTLAYVLSQFYRAFLAVLAPALTADLGMDAAELSRASGLFFVVFAITQLPVGWALDRIGPRRTSAAMTGIVGTAGAALFALATSGWQVELALVLIAVGCAPALVANYYIVARTYPPAVFATMAGVLVGVGSLGNIAASAPLGWAAEALGWRGAMWALAATGAAVGLACLAFVRDPQAAEADAAGGSIWRILKMPAMWAILPMMLVNYAPAAGLRGLWAGPYVADLYGAGYVGTVTFVMGLAMIAGNFLYGPADRLFGTRKWVVLGGNLAAAGFCAALWLVPAPGLVASALLLAAVGLFGSSYAVCIAHGRAFFPPHLTGRGVTLLNFFSMGGVGIMQFATGPIFEAAGGGVAGYSTLFGGFALALLAGCAIYLAAPDKVD